MIKNNRLTTRKRERNNSFLVACFLQINMFTLLFEQINGIIVILATFIALIFFFNNGLSLRINTMKMTVYVLALMCFVISFLVYGINDYNSNYFLFFIVFGSLGFILSGSVFDSTYVYSFMVLTAIPVVVKSLITRAYIVDYTRVDFYGYLMGITYALLPAYISSLLMIMKNLIPKKKRILKIINLLVFLSITFIFAKAAPRGVILSVIVFIVGFKTFIDNRKEMKSIIFKIILLVLVFFSIMFFKELLMIIQVMMVKVDIKVDAINKTIRLLESNSGLSNGRLNIWFLAIKDTLSSPFWGYGIGSYEQRYLSGYVHNIFIQIIYELGYIVFFCVSIVSFYKIKQVFDQQYKTFLWFLISIGIVELFFSSVFWLSPRFWFFIGFIAIQRSTTIHLFKTNEMIIER